MCFFLAQIKIMYVHLPKYPFLKLTEEKLTTFRLFHVSRTRNRAARYKKIFAYSMRAIILLLCGFVSDKEKGNP